MALNPFDKLNNQRTYVYPYQRDKFSVNKMNQKVIVSQVNPNTKGGNTVAFLVVNIFGLVVYGTRIIAGRGDQPFVAYPSYKASSGKYKEIIQIEDPALDREVKEEILRQYYLKSNEGRVNPFLPVLDDDKPETEPEGGEK